MAATETAISVEGEDPRVRWRHRRPTAYVTGGGDPAALAAGSVHEREAGVLKGRARERHRKVVGVWAGDDVVPVEDVLPEGRIQRAAPGERDRDAKPSGAGCA